MGLNTNVAEQVRKSALGRDVRKPIADGCEYTSFNEVKSHAINALNDMISDAEDTLDSSLRSEKHNLNSTIVSGKNDLKDTVYDNKKRLQSVLVTEEILLRKDVEYQTAHFYEEFRKSIDALPHMRQTLKDDLAEVEEIRQSANDDLDVIDTKCDTRIAEVETIPIPGKEEYCTMALIYGGDANG